MDVNGVVAERRVWVAAEAKTIPQIPHGQSPGQGEVRSKRQALEPRKSEKKITLARKPKLRCAEPLKRCRLGYETTPRSARVNGGRQSNDFSRDIAALRHGVPAPLRTMRTSAKTLAGARWYAVTRRYGGHLCSLPVIRDVDSSPLNVAFRYPTTVESGNNMLLHLRC